MKCVICGLAADCRCGSVGEIATLKKQLDTEVGMVVKLKLELSDTKLQIEELKRISKEDTEHAAAVEAEATELQRLNEELQKKAEKLGRAPTWHLHAENCNRKALEDFVESYCLWYNDVKPIEKPMRDDLPACGSCQSFGTLCGHHKPKTEKRVDAVPNAEPARDWKCAKCGKISQFKDGLCWDCFGGDPGQ